MNNNAISLTEGLLIIEFPGRGVSLQRAGKSHTKCGRKEGKVRFGLTLSNTKEAPEHTDNRPTVFRYGGEITREIVPTCKPAHQIVKITEELVQHWATNPMPDEFIRTAEGKKFKLKYKPAQRFQMRLQEHFECICIAANLLPERCSWVYKT